MSDPIHAATPAGEPRCGSHGPGRRVGRDEWWAVSRPACLLLTYADPIEPPPPDVAALLLPFARWGAALDAERANLHLPPLPDTDELIQPGIVASDHAATVGDLRAAARALTGTLNAASP